MRDVAPVDGVLEPGANCRRVPALLALVLAAATLLACWQAQVPRGLLVVGTLVPGLAAGVASAVRGRQAAWSRRIVWVLFGASAMTAATAVAWILPLWLGLVTLLLGASVVRLRPKPRKLAFFGALSLFMGGIGLNVYALSPFVTHTPLSADPAAFRAVDLRVHGLLADVTLRDAWVIRLRGGGEGRSVLDAVRGPAGRQTSRERPSPALALLSAALVGIRLGLGWVLGLDSEADTDSSASYANRLTAADRTRCVVKCPGERHPPFGFRLLYHFDRELTYEVQNRTVHAFLSLALVPAADGYDLYYAVYVKRASWMTPVYMATIDPFRRMVMYPSMLRTLERRWRTEWGQ